MAKKSEEMKKVKGKVQKEEMKDVKTGNVGIGDAFAMAVKGLQDRARGIKGNGFLGVVDKLLNPADYVGKDKLNVKKEK